MNEPIQEALRQVVEGDDFTAPAKLLADLTPQQATSAIGGSAESIASIVWHTLFWIEAWNAAVEGDTERLKWIPNDETWPQIAIDEWPALRDKFISALSKSQHLAATVNPDTPGKPVGRTAAQNLLQTAVHTAYHLGQIVLIRRNAGIWPPRGGE
jgi:uncharacterized damage-inducible protein DinB